MARGLKRGLTWAALVLVLLGVVAAAAGTLLVRGSLARLDGESALPGLASPARVERDALGNVTIDAGNPTDAARVLGYVHAQERYFEMDLMRRAAAGELAALFGPAAVETDKRLRVHRMRQRARAHLDTFGEGHRDRLEAYVEGVNAGLADLEVRPWPYLLLRQAPQPWQLEDSALAGFAMYFDLQDEANDREFALWQMRPHMPAPLWALLTHAGSRWDAPLVGGPIGDAPLPDAATVDLRRLPAPGVHHPRPLPATTAPGSNNFAVSGALTAHGGAIVADDMHLGLGVPNIWFRARLRYPDPLAPGGRVDATGFTLPGLPAIVVGSNGHVAWAFTNSYGDWLDWQELPACDRGPDTGCPGVERHLERIDVAGGDPVELEVEETRWGPILHRLPDGRALALRWVAHQPGALSVGLMDFLRADSVEAALRVADRTAVPAQNLLVGDRQGRIAWRLLGPLPRRADGCQATPQAGAAGPLNPASACPPWPLEPATGVSIVDPADGRLWTANSRVVDGAMLARIGDGGYALGARAMQIRDGLRGRGRFDEASLLALQLDDRALFLERWWRLLQEEAARGGSPALVAIAGASREWRGRASVDAVDYRLVRGWRNEVHARIADGLTAPARAALGDAFEMPKLPQLEGVAWPLVTRQPAHLLPARFDSWPALFEDAASTVRQQLEAEGRLDARTWGERNTADICHPLQQAMPGFTRGWLCMPADPLPGDTDMPLVQGPDFGASERMVVSPGREAEGIAHMPGGQSGHPLSPFWGAGHDDWVHGRPTPFLPGEARYLLRLEPGLP